MVRAAGDLDGVAAGGEGDEHGGVTAPFRQRKGAQCPRGGAEFTDILVAPDGDAFACVAFSAGAAPTPNQPPKPPENVPGAVLPPRVSQIRIDYGAATPVSSEGVRFRYRLEGFDRDWVDAWMDYMVRLPRELQVMFAMQVRKNNYPKRDEVMSNAKFTKWCLDNNFIATTDKK